MDEIIKKLYDSFNKGPAFLFLGQDYLKLEMGEDPFLSEIIRKYGEKRDETPSYHDILSGEAQNSPSDSLAWMQGRCERFKPAKWLKVVSNYSWNGVYTSAIDLIWPDVFRSDWREIQPIFDEKYNPSDPRNRHNLHCTFLYGRVDREDESERVPLNQREWHKRKQIAIALARRLPELVTPIGEGGAAIRPATRRKDRGASGRYGAGSIEAPAPAGPETPVCRVNYAGVTRCR